MKLLGDEMLNSGEVLSSEFSDNTVKFNRLTVNSMSEVDLQSVNKNVIITPLDSKDVYFNDKVSDVWNNWEQDVGVKQRINISSPNNFNYIHFLSSIGRNFSIDNSALSGLPSDASFVIDWWMFQYDANVDGCLMYNGSTLSPNPVENKELCISTSGDIVDPTTLDVTANPGNDGYLNILYPPLKSLNKINDDFWHHFALVAQDGQIQLIVDSKVNDQTQFDGINSIEDLFFGFGYSSGIEAYVSSLRITKNSDLNWFDGNFDLPVNDYNVDANTEFLMDSTSLVDTTANNAVTVFGDALNIYQEDHYIYLQKSYRHAIVSFNFDADATVYLPYSNSPIGLELINKSNHKVILKSLDFKDSNEFHFYPVAHGVTMFNINDKWVPHESHYDGVIPKEQHDYPITQSVVISSYDGGATLNQHGHDIRVIDPASPPALIYDRTCPVRFNNNVIDMRVGSWPFAAPLILPDAWVNTATIDRSQCSFYIKLLADLPNDFKLLTGNGDIFGFDYMTATRAYPCTWLRYRASGTLQRTGYPSFVWNPDTWFHIKLEYRSVCWTWGTGTTPIWRYGRITVSNWDKTQTLVNSELRDSRVQSDSSTYYWGWSAMPHSFTQGNYLIAGLQLDNT